MDRRRRRADRQGHATASSAPAKDADFLKFVYDTAGNAKVFAQSWDQALSPTAAETLLDNIAKLFQLSITPQQFVDNMNAGHRQVTTLAPPAVRVTAADHLEPAGGAASVAWMALPALLIFVAFGVIPLLGVLVLSFTTWDGIGDDPRRPASTAGGPCSPTPACRTRSG